MPPIQIISLLVAYGLVFTLQLYTTRQISAQENAVHDVRHFNKKMWEL